NPLLISPDQLLQEGLLTGEDVSSTPDFNDDKADFEKVRSYKYGRVDKAYEHCTEKEKKFTIPFTELCEENKDGLADYAIYRTLKIKYKSNWTEWPKAIRNREAKTVANRKNELAQGIKKEKIIQYLFFSQWQKLADYCHQKEVYLI